jgi:hypothetical protein
MTAGAWASDWNGTKADFKEATGKSKPETAKKFLGKFTVHRTKVADALKDCDKVWVVYQDEINKIPKFKTDKEIAKQEVAAHDASNAFSRAVKAFRTSKEAYLPAVAKAIEDDFDKNEVKTIYYKSCRLLEKTLDSIDKELTAQQATLMALLNETVKAAKEGTGRADAKAIVNATLKTSLIAQLAQSRKFTATLKVVAMKDMPKCIEAFNRGVKDAIRNVTQPLVNFSKQGVAPPQAPMTWLSARNDGNYKLPAGTDNQTFLSELKILDTHLKAVSAWVEQLH